MMTNIVSFGQYWLSYILVIKNHPNRVSNYRKYFNGSNIEGFDFIKGYKCSDVFIFENLNILLINIFELNLYHDQNKWKHKLIPIEVSKNESDRFIDLIIYKNHYVPIEKIHLFLGNHNCNYVCRRCLKSYTIQNVLIKHIQQCGE